MENSSQTQQLHSLHKWYSGVHGYLSLFICLFGIPMNFINITVLTRPHMRTPINCILTWLAVFDMFTMASYLPFALHFYCIHSPWELSLEKNRYHGRDGTTTTGSTDERLPGSRKYTMLSIAWMQFMIFHINFSSTTHTVSVWLGVTLAIFRYKHIFSPAKGHLTRMRRLVHARLSVLIVTLLAVVGLVPNYLTNRLYAIQVGGNLTLWVMEDLQLATASTQPIVLVNLWLYSIAAKLFPCLLMVVYGSLLLTTLQASLHQRLKRRRPNHPAGSSRQGSDTGRTTRMLLVVIVLFVVTELPQAVLIMLSVTVKNFFYQVYMPLGDLMDMLALINNGVNFVLYCSMSRDFRNTVVSLIRTGRDLHHYTGIRRSPPSVASDSGSRGNHFHLSINGLAAVQCSTVSDMSQSALVVKISGGSSVETLCVRS